MEAADEAAAWPDRLVASEFLGVSVNVTTQHLAHAGFAKELAATLDARSLPQDHLQVELTERVLMETSNSAMMELRTLRDAGVE